MEDDAEETAATDAPFSAPNEISWADATDQALDGEQAPSKSGRAGSVRSTGVHGFIDRCSLLDNETLKQHLWEFESGEDGSDDNIFSWLQGAISTPLNVGEVRRLTEHIRERDLSWAPDVGIAVCTIAHGGGRRDVKCP